MDRGNTFKQNGPTPLYVPIYKVGESGVGKTSLLYKYVKGNCDKTYPTIGAEFCTKELNMKDGNVIRVQLWDTAGQERFKSIVSMYYRRAMGVLLVYDVTQRESFAVCKKFLTELKTYTDPSCITYLVGNKIDLENQRKVSTNEGRSFAKENGLNFLETSAVKNIQVTEAFEYLVDAIHQIQKNVRITETTVDLSKGKGQNEGCC